MQNTFQLLFFLALCNIHQQLHNLALLLSDQLPAAVLTYVLQTAGCSFANLLQLTELNNADQTIYQLKAGKLTRVLHVEPKLQI